MSAAIIFDTETTGIVEPALVEAAWLPVGRGEHGRLVQGDPVCRRYNPGKPIELGASVVHHIFNSDVDDEEPASAFKLAPGTEYLIGHNIDFDWAVIGKPDVKRICTLALARIAWPTLDSHSLTACFYHLRGVDGRPMARGAHSAAADVAMNAEVFLELVGEAHDLDEVWRVSEVARVPKVMPFGKHKGVEIERVPRDYKNWLLRQADVDPYLVKALQGTAS